MKPRVELPWERIDTVLQAGGLAPLAVMGAVLGFWWNELPQHMPTHYDMSGTADAWGDKSTVLILPVTAVVISVLLSLVARVPHLANLPAEVTPNNARPIYLLTRRSLFGLLLLCNLLFLGLFLVTTSVADTKSSGSGAVPAFTAGFTVAILVGLIWFVVKVRAIARES